MKEHKIKLGDKVEDIITGYTGIAVARTEFLNGCIQYSISKKLKAGQELSITGDPSIDEMCLKVIQKKVIKSKEYEREEELKEEKTNGGPVRFMKPMRGY